MASYKCRQCDLRVADGNALCPLCTKKFMICYVCDKVTPNIRRGSATSIACAECLAASKGLCTKCGKPITNEFSTIRLGRRGRNAMAVCQRCRADMMPLAHLHGLPTLGDALFDSDEALVSSLGALKLVTYELNIPESNWIPQAQMKFIPKLKESLKGLKTPINIVLYPVLPLNSVGKPSGKVYLGCYRGNTAAYNNMPEACRSYMVHAGGYELAEDLPTSLTGLWPASLAQVLVSHKIVSLDDHPMWTEYVAPKAPESFKDVANFIWVEANRVSELVRLVQRRPNNFYGVAVDAFDEGR